MVIASEPPLTGEQFVVAWFFDGNVESDVVRYEEEHECFVKKSMGAWMPVSGEYKYFIGTTIIVSK